jgi:hypothetical protein
MATEPLVREDRFAVMPATVAPLAPLENPKARRSGRSRHLPARRLQLAQAALPASITKPARTQPSNLLQVIKVPNHQQFVGN